MNETNQVVTSFDAQDVEKNKALAIVGYIFPIIFFIPLITEAKDSVFAKFHANQQLILLILGIAGGIIRVVITIALAFIPFVGPMMGKLLGYAFPFIYLALAVLGVMNASNGTPKKLPVVGDLATFIK